MIAKKKKAFSLIELILSLSIIGLLAGLSLPIFTSLQSRSNVDDAIIMTASALRRTRQMSKASYFDSSWSVKIESGKLTIFQGTDFASRNQQYDEIIKIVDNIALSGLNEINFSKSESKPSSTGTITYSYQNNQKTIIINKAGVLEY